MFFKRFVLDLDGCEHYPRVIFDRGHSQAFSHRAFKLPTVVTRVLSLPCSLENRKLTLLTLALLVYRTTGAEERSSARL